MTEFDYLGAAAHIAYLFPQLTQFESPEEAMRSDSMELCHKLVAGMTATQFAISLGIALSFNVSRPPADSTLDDVSDEYLRAHPEKQKALQEIVESIEDKKRDASEDLI